MNEVIKRYKPFNPDEKNLSEILSKIKNRFEDVISNSISSISKLSEGQNLNYLMQCDNSQKHLLKLISNKGYPCINSIARCYDLLNSIGLSQYKIIDFDITNNFAPYGFLIQNWIDGKSADDYFQTSFEDMCYKPDKQDWIVDYAKILNEIHKIKLDYFGDLEQKVKFTSLRDYYLNLDQIVSTSFGEILLEQTTIWDLCNKGVVARNFVIDVFKEIKNLTTDRFINKKPVLIYGDMLPANIIYSKNKPVIIDWDETKSNWWVYELARTLYYIHSIPLAEKFLAYYDHSDTLKEIDLGIRIEHIKQDLRQIYFAVFISRSHSEIQDKVNTIKSKIVNKLSKPILE